jgi:ribosome-binding ATPase
MKIGIVGLPNVGKSTLFKALTRNPVDISNYPFCTIEPNVGVVKVPDERLEKLAKMSHSAKIIPAVIEFVDIAGLVKGASEGEGLGNKFLSHIREVDAIVQVVRVFKDSRITHVHNVVDPMSDLEVINTELILADLETIKKAENRIDKEIKSNVKEADKKLAVVKNIKKNLESGNLASLTKLDLVDEVVKITVRELSLLTMKPFLYAYNISNFDEKLPEELLKRDHVVLDIKIEEELIEIGEEELKELKLESNLEKLIVRSYKILGLITFLTTGEDETRAWTIKRDSTAPIAGAAIHNDFKDKFIRADVIAWDKLLEIGSWIKSKETGIMKTVGKDYIVQDGDVIEFKI